MVIKKIAICIVVLFMVLAGIIGFFALYSFINNSLDSKIPKEILIEYNRTRFCQVNCSNGFYWEGICEELKAPPNIDCIIKINETIEGSITQKCKKA